MKPWLKPLLIIGPILLGLAISVLMTVFVTSMYSLRLDPCSNTPQLQSFCPQSIEVKSRGYPFKSQSFTDSNTQNTYPGPNQQYHTTVFDFDVPWPEWVINWIVWSLPLLFVSFIVWRTNMAKRV
jgi:hypothetical protein